MLIAVSEKTNCMPFLLTLILSFFITHHTQRTDPLYETRIASPSKISILWKDGKGHNITSFQKLKQVVPGVTYAMNGGLYVRGFNSLWLAGTGRQGVKELKILKRGNDNFSMQH